MLCLLLRFVSHVVCMYDIFPYHNLPKSNRDLSVLPVVQPLRSTTIFILDPKTQPSPAQLILTCCVSLHETQTRGILQHARRFPALYIDFTFHVPQPLDET